MAVTSDRPAPYAPPSAIIEIIERYRNRGLSKPFTADVLGRAGVSESLIPRTIQALQSLELITEDGMPTAIFEGIRTSPEPELKQRLEEWIRRVYSDVFQYVEPTKDSEVAIRDAFRSYNPVGQQPRMVSLFLGLCEKAGIREPSKQEGAPRADRQRVVQTTPRTKKVVKPTRREFSDTTSVGAGGLPPAISGLLASLPSEGTGWTQQQRDKFVATFSVVLDFSYPIRESNDEAGDTEEA